LYNSLVLIKWKISFNNILKSINLTFNLEGNQIKCETEVKLLGVAIDFKLNFNENISSFGLWRTI
jgi:hypothetical protein